MSNNHQKRIELFQEINTICRDLAFIQDGRKNPFRWRVNSIKKFWIQFFGFMSLVEMTVEDLENFTALLKAKIKAEYKSKAFPFFHE